jgi:hypothetical protein
MPRLSYLVAGACPVVGVASVATGHVGAGVGLLVASVVAFVVAADDWLEGLPS